VIVTRYVEPMTVSDEFLRPSAAPLRTRSGVRRLDPERDRAIAAAVLEVLARDGYAGLTMDAVALAAGVGKATIYRRWSSKADLLLSVLDVAGDDLLAAPDTGCLREDLLAVLTATVELLAGPSGRAARSLLGVVVDDPALSEAYERGPLSCWREAMATVLDRAVARGEITAEVRRSPAASAGPAIILLRWLVTGRPLDAGVVTGIVDDVMLPLLRR
jgi:AcrR family transcriptional regulator